MEDTARLFDDTEPELVFHLAAEVGGIGANRANPGRYWYANLMMGAHVLEQARLHGTPKLVVAGTICAYPKFAPVPFHEDDLWNGYPEETNAPYGVAKKAILVGAQSYREQYGTNSIFLLPVNLYGPGDNFDLQTSHVIPALIRKMVEAHARGDEEIVLWGDGTPTREFLYVDDCARGLALAGRALRRRRAGQPRYRRGDRDPRARRADPRGDGLRRCDPLGHVPAERAAAPPARHDARARAVRLRGRGAAAGRHRTHRGLVPRAGMTEAAAAARPSRVLAALGRAADAVARHVVVALATILAVQILATVALFFSVNRNGWLTYQGGDQIWLVTSAWLLGKGTIGYALTSHGWPMLLAPLTWITGSSSVQLLPLTTILQVGVLGPIATLAVYDIGARLAGRLAGVWCASAFAVAPFVAIPYFVQRYHDSWVDQFLPQALGLTQQADFPSVVAVLVAAALTVRALQAARLPRGGARRDLRGSGARAQAGERALPRRPGARVPHRATLARRRRSSPYRSRLRSSRSPSGSRRGSARCRCSRTAQVRLAAGLGDPIVLSPTSWFERTIHLNFDTWKQNMSGLREFTWSARVLQFLPLAGALAVARRSIAASGLLLGWLLGYVVVKSAADVATVESGSYWRLIMPALPAFVLLSASVPLLVPTFLDRMGPRLAPLPGRRPGRRSTIAVVAFLAVVPIVAILLSDLALVTRQATPPRAYIVPELVVNEIGVPVDRGRDRPRRSPRRRRQRADLVGLDGTCPHVLPRVPRLAVEGLLGDDLRAARRPLRLPRGNPRDDARPDVRGPESATGRDLPGRRRGELARRREPRRRLRDQPARGSVAGSRASSRSSASTRARSSATSWARRTLSSVSRERTVE